MRRDPSISEAIAPVERLSVERAEPRKLLRFLSSRPRVSPARVSRKIVRRLGWSNDVRPIVRSTPSIKTSILSAAILACSNGNAIAGNSVPDWRNLPEPFASCLRDDVPTQERIAGLVESGWGRSETTLEIITAYYLAMAIEDARPEDADELSALLEASLKEMNTSPETLAVFDGINFWHHSDLKNQWLLLVDFGPRIECIFFALSTPDAASLLVERPSTSASEPLPPLYVDFEATYALSMRNLYSERSEVSDAYYFLPFQPAFSSDLARSTPRFAAFISRPVPRNMRTK